MEGGGHLPPGLLTGPTCQSTVVWLSLCPVQPQGPVCSHSCLSHVPACSPSFSTQLGQNQRPGPGKNCFSPFSCEGEGDKIGTPVAGSFVRSSGCLGLGERVMVLWSLKGSDPLLPYVAQPCKDAWPRCPHSLLQGCEPLRSTRPIRRSHLSKGGAVVQGGRKPPCPRLPAPIAAPGPPL